MSPWPSVNLWAPFAAGVVAMVLGGVYYRARARLSDESPFPPGARVAPALGYGFVSRIWIAYAIAVIIGFAHVRGVVPGAVAGALLYLVFPGTMQVAQAFFGVVPWRNLPVGGTEALMGFAVMGGVVGAFAP